MNQIIDIVEVYIVGPQGKSGTIESATATGLAPGADPTVTLGGTPEQRTIAFGIPEGEPGTPATITGATAETLPPQSEASVTVGGTPGARTFKFGIPKGEPGEGSVNSVNGDLGPDIVLDADDVGAVPTTQHATTTQRGIVELSTDQESIDGNDSERAVTPASLKATLAATTVSSTDLVSKIRYPMFVSHRGAPLLHPEHSIEGYRRSYEAGFTPEPDVQSIAGGKLVCIHDSTTNRTMSIQKSVSAVTETEWRTGRINPPKGSGDLHGTGYGTPVFFDDYLDEFGGKIALLPEIKNVADAPAIIAAVKARGLEKSVVLQSFSLPAVQQVIAAGCYGLLLGATQTPSTLAAQDVWGVGLAYASATNAYITACKNAGLKVAVYTVNTRQQALTELGRGVDIIFSDDPWEVSREFTPKQTIDLVSGFLPPASAQMRNTDIPSVRNITVSPGRLDFYNAAYASANQRNTIKVGSFGYMGPNAKLRFTTVSRSSSNTANPTNSWLFGVYLGERADSAPINEESAERWRLAMCRRNGEVNVYNKTAYGGSITKIGTKELANFASANGAGPSEWEVEFTSTAVIITCLSRGGAGSSDNETYTVSHAAWSGSDLYVCFTINGANVALYDISCVR